MEKNKRRKLKKMSKKRRRNRMMRIFLRVILLLIILLTLILGFFVGWHFYRNIYSQVDIILDAGHGGKDPGANNGDAVEKDITLAIARMTEEILKDSGYKVKMIRDDDSFIELTERPEIANRRNAKVYVSIHCNSSEDGEGKGIETFYTEQKGESNQELAEQIHIELIKHTEASDRGVKTADYTVLVKTDMPAVLIETGFLTNLTERELLTENSYQEKVAHGIAEGIIEYLRETQ